MGACTKCIAIFPSRLPTFGVFKSQDVFEIKRFRFYFSEKSKFGVLFFPQQLTHVVALLVKTRLVSQSNFSLSPKAIFILLHNLF